MNNWISPMPTLAFDLDGDQIVSAAEFAAVVDDIIADFDSDGDGNFSKEERALLVEAAHQSQKSLERRERASAR